VGAAAVLVTGRLRTATVLIGVATAVIVIALSVALTVMTIARPLI